MNTKEIRDYTWARTEVITNPKSSAYFTDLAFKHLPEMKLLIGGGKLSKKEGWRNVAQHCILQIAVMDIMCDFLQLPDGDKKKLMTVAGSHDWKKQIEIKGLDVSHDKEWSERIENYLLAVNPDQEIMSSTGPDFIPKGLNGEASRLQKLAFYVDDIVSENMVVPILDRLYENKLKKRVKALDSDQNLTNRLGGVRYSDAEIKLGTTVEKEFVEEIEKKNDLEIDSPESLPTVILAELNRRINSFSK